MATNPNPEPLTFSELYDLKVVAIRQTKEARKNLDRLRKSTGRTAATTNAIDRWQEVRDTYEALITRLQSFIDVKLAENDKLPSPMPTARPAHFRSDAKAYDANGEHTGPGDWLTVIRTANGIAKDEGQDILFGSPESSGDWWAGGYVEEYPEARVLHREDGSVSVLSKTDLGARLIRQAAEKHGWIA